MPASCYNLLITVTFVWTIKSIPRSKPATGGAIILEATSLVKPGRAY